MKVFWAVSKNTFRDVRAKNSRLQQNRIIQKNMQIIETYRKNNPSYERVNGE